MKATLAGDEATVCKVLDYAHNTEISLLSYNQELELTVVITLAYLSARDSYEVSREEKSGVGYVELCVFHGIS